MVNFDFSWTLSFDLKENSASDKEKKNSVPKMNGAFKGKEQHGGKD